jgi:lipopolysaccharide transport system ATP-binding protein
MSDVLIKVENVSKKFCRDLKKSLWYGVKDIAGELSRRGISRDALRPGEFWSVKDISFELKRGECLGLIGANGAGKSTLLKMLNGLIKPDQGRISMRGRVGALIELGAGFNPILTGRENIYVNGAVLGFTKEEIGRKFDEIVEFAEINEFIDTPVQNYSSGMKVRLGFAVAAQMEPDVLLIDEVLAVGDIGFRVKCLNRISELLAQSAVIFVSHAMPQIARICTHTMLMKKGQSLLFTPGTSQAIDLYYQEFDTGKKLNTISNDFEVRNVSLNAGAEEDCPVVPFDGQLQIDMDCHVSAMRKNIQLQIIVWNQEQRPVLDVLTEDFQPYSWQNETEKVSLSVVIPSLRLAGGKYTIVIWASDQENMEIICRVENAATFVMGHHRSTASELMHPAHWLIRQ